MNKLDKKNIEDILALTPMQEGMLFHYLKDPQSDHYFEQLSLEISGEINDQHFENAWNVVVETNEMLRTVFHWEKVEKPVQIVLKEHKLQPVYYDFSGKYAGKEVEKVRLKDRNETFDLRRVPFRVTLCKVGKDKYEMIISSHHILYDGWSNGVILKEFFSAYDALSNGKEWLKPVKTKFKEFVKGCQTRDTTAHKNYWENVLKGFDTPAVFSIKGTWPQEEKGASHYSNYQLRFPKDTLEDFVKEYKITLASLLYGSWGILLQKYNNSGDVVFGTTVSGRSGAGASSGGLPGIEECVGLFINTVPLRIKAGSEDGITAFLGKLNRELRDREDFEGTSLVDIKDYSELGSEEELFDTIVVIENYPLEKSLAERTAGGLAIAGYSMYERTHYDFTLIINVIDDVEANFYYNNQL
jgi:iturin family lipopeptide synthetase B